MCGGTLCTSFVASVAQWNGVGGVPVEILSELVRHVQRHVVPRIVGIESVADVTQIAASQFNLVEAGREFFIRQNGRQVCGETGKAQNYTQPLLR